MTNVIQTSNPGKCRPINRREIAGCVRFARELVRDAGDETNTVKLGSLAGSAHVPPGPEYELAQRGVQAIDRLRSCLDDLAFQIELVASEIGMSVDPSDAGGNLDGIAFVEERSGVVDGSNQKDGAA